MSHIDGNIDLVALIKAEIETQSPMPFDRFMDLALYHPTWGYYLQAQSPMGPAGDYMTAPEFSSHFSRSLAVLLQRVMQTLKSATPTTPQEERNLSVLELGPGRGILARNLLEYCPEITHYYLLERSTTLIAEQKRQISALSPALQSKCIWLSEPPKNFTGVVLANEVLDALPVKRFEWHEDAPLQECCVDVNADGALCWANKAADEALTQAVTQCYNDMAPLIWPSPFRSEYLASLPAFTQPIYDGLEQSIVLWIDYGYPAHELYHPQRSEGTLTCFYQHQSHTNPFVHLGKQDITAHVNFTQVALDAHEQGLQILGFGTQADFLIHHDVLKNAESLETEEYAALKKLLMPYSMGEVIKVLCVGKGMQYAAFASTTDQKDRLFGFSV